MPYGFGSSAVFTSSAGGDVGGGRNWTRLRGPVLVGAVAAEVGSSAGTQAAPWQVGHVANVSTKLADTLISPATGVFLSTASTVGFVYITQSTFAWSASSAANIGPTPAPGVLNGAAIVWDSGRNKLSVFSTVLNDWLSVTLTSS